MEKNLVLKLKGNIINDNVERLGYLVGTFYSVVPQWNPETLKVLMTTKKPDDIITFRKLSEDITFYKGTSFDNLTKIKDNTVELQYKSTTKKMYIKGTEDFFFVKPSLGSKVEIGLASNINSFGYIGTDWAPNDNFLVNANNSFATNLLIESSNLLECEHLSKISLGVLVDITDMSDITELKLDNLQGNIIVPSSEIEFNKLVNENSEIPQGLGQIRIVTKKEGNTTSTDNGSIIKLNLTGTNYNSDNISFKNNSVVVSYSGTESDYPFRLNKTKIREIEFKGDGTNFDTFFKALTKYDSIKNIDVKNVIITDASNSAIKQLKTKVTGIFKINNVDKKA